MNRSQRVYETPHTARMNATVADRLENRVTSLDFCTHPKAQEEEIRNFPNAAACQFTGMYFSVNLN